MRRNYFAIIIITLRIIIGGTTETFGQTKKDVATEVNLQEVRVSVRRISANSMIKRAKEMMPANYPTQNCRYDMDVKHNIESNGQIISWFNGKTTFAANGYQQKHDCEIRLVDYSEFVNNRDKLTFKIPPRYDAFPNILVDNMFVGQIDFIANSNKYDFQYSDDETEEKATITFKPKKQGKRHFYRGKLIINKHNYAIEKMQYDIDTDKDMLSDKDGWLEISWRVKVTITGINYTDAGTTIVSFEKQNGKYHVAEISNSYEYRYVKTNGPTTTYHATNKLKFSLTERTDINNLKPISLYLENLDEYKYNKIDSANLKKYYKNIEKKMKKLIKEHPELEEEINIAIEECH